MASFAKHKMQLSQARIAIFDLGYAELPLAVEFGKQHDTIGFDVSAERIGELCSGNDRAAEIDHLSRPVQLTSSSELGDVRSCNVSIVALPRCDGLNLISPSSMRACQTI
ncbi:hypothetical protein [Thioclava sp.]|uniref:hypothetical protein n=1 Tax=Thioclava sp. TaxID=1933450 RepID=UPI003AA93A5A